MSGWGSFRVKGCCRGEGAGRGRVDGEWVVSTRASNWVWELEDLGPSETLVLLALADQANDAGVAWPAQGSLARRARQTDRNVRRMLVKLERMGLLSVERRSSSHGRKSNRYRLHVGARIGESLESRQPDELSGCATGH